MKNENTYAFVRCLDALHNISSQDRKTEKQRVGSNLLQQTYSTSSTWTLVSLNHNKARPEGIRILKKHITISEKLRKRQNTESKAGKSCTRALLICMSIINIFLNSNH
jgi:hypothetical protein